MAAPPERVSPASVVQLRCEQFSRAEGIDVLRPRLSWQIESPQRNERQTAYRVVAASSEQALEQDKGDLWDSGKVASDQSILVPYAGGALPSRMHCFWKVRVWDKDGLPSKWSAAAEWSMGLMKEEDLQARWIGLDSTSLSNQDRLLPARYLRKEFTVEKALRRATASICGLGLFELQINGQKIGDHVLEPALSEYDKRAYYETFDVTHELAAGSNAVLVILGNGRFYGPRPPRATTSFGCPKLLMQVDLDYEDGSTGQIVSDESWLISTNGPIGANNEYDGEECDARKGMTDWQPAQFVEPGAPVISAQMIEPMMSTERLQPKTVNRLMNGVYIFDMGQNMVGRCRLRATGPAGTKITLRHAETLNEDGTLYTNNLRTAKATDTFILKGGGEEVLEAKFTYHGFRFVELAGFPGEPALTNIEGHVIHDGLGDAGHFACSNPMLEQIARNIRWGVRGNFRSMPTDCPQRDERQGWTGDRSEESRGETYLFDVEAFYSKWLQDLHDAQRPGGSVPDVAPAFWTVYNDGVSWASTYLVLAHALYDQYGDLAPLQTHYASMTQWIDCMQRYVTNGIIAKNSYGDWCVPPASPKEIHSKDPDRLTDGALISTAYFYRDLLLMKRAATLLGHPEDAGRFGKMAAATKAALNRKFLDAKTGRYANGTPTSSVLGLADWLTPERAKTFAQLVKHIETKSEGHIGTGVIGCQYLMRTLSDNGRIDLAYELATNTTYPSWGYMIGKGATTIWELWNGDTADPAMNSGNHVMLIGDLNIWLYEHLGGIRPAAPGFKKIVIKPQPCGDLTWVRASHKSPYGMIETEWRRDYGHFRLSVTIPPNTTATVCMPGRKRGIEIGSGEYQFEGAE